MSGQIRPSTLTPAQEPDAPVSQAAATQIHRSRSSWPTSRLAAAIFTVLLAVCLGLPIALRGGRDLQLPALLLPALLATAGARITFDAVDGFTSGSGARGHFPGAAIGAATGTIVVACASLILALRPSLASIGLTAGVSAGTLLGAGLARDLEIRVRLALRRVCFVGTPVSRQDLYYELGRRRDAQLVATVTSNVAAVDSGALVSAVRDAHATVLVLERDALQVPRIVEAAGQLNLEGIQVRDLVTYYESEFKKVPLSELTPTWFLFDLAAIHEQVVSRLLRRSLELLISLALLLFSLPILIIAWLAVLVTSPGPGLYRQTRVGRGGVPFTLLKVRTMRLTDAPAAWAGAHAHRVTPVGRFLRRFRLDELPQLWNVMRGDLALIGPRPEQVPIVRDLERQIPFYAARHSVRPGLTGWAQVNLGYAGSLEGTMAKLQRDLYYVKHSSWRLDGLIIWLTLKAVMSNPG